MYIILEAQLFSFSIICDTKYLSYCRRRKASGLCFPHCETSANRALKPQFLLGFRSKLVLHNLGFLEIKEALVGLKSVNIH